MPNITISVPEELYQRMQRFPEIKWSVVIRRFLEEYLMRLEGVREVEATKLAEILGIREELERIPDEVALDYAREAVKRRGRRAVRH